MQAKKAADELIAESQGLIDHARKLQEQAATMPAGDPERKRLEALAEDLLDRSVRISATAKKMLR